MTSFDHRQRPATPAKPDARPNTRIRPCPTRCRPRSRRCAQCRAGMDLRLWLSDVGHEFPRAEAEPALLHGYHRCFCLYSYDYRGTRARPGLTLGLDRGGACRGIVLRLPPEALAETIDRLWSREMTAPRVYDMRRLPVRTGSGSRRAFAFTVRRDHPDYAGRLPLTRPRGSSPVPPGAAAAAATISRAPYATSTNSASPIGSCAVSAGGSQRSARSVHLFHLRAAEFSRRLPANRARRYVPETHERGEPPQRHFLLRVRARLVRKVEVLPR